MIWTLELANVLIVGYANIGDISLQWSLDKKEVIQCLWWCHPDNPGRLTPRTEYCDTLDPPAFEAAPGILSQESRAHDSKVAVA